MIPPSSPPWLKVAYSYLGRSEIKGPSTAPFISKWLQKLHAWWKDDEAAWCGTAIAGWLSDCNDLYHTRLVWPKAWYRALSWADTRYGRHLNPFEYRPGAICVKTRKGGGHVFLYVGENQTSIFGIAGNTGDRVKEAWYLKAEVLTVVWPQGATFIPGNMRNFLVPPNQSTSPQKED